ncbi:hypothetical protein AVDCRST_MAG82-3412 [uncultured Rubrobacteraceae bacterium]|uniref:Uncharacterized protein n=1 Tax=uncultured Rubrobacteraceae bacterium TaxID=349277 RepID=A0A6J4QJS7_9ACTN|nr:hypothetical protein AVDCRST_MAG82-3412 [uncultured Rubrobacteraceae bacterium]
MRHDNTSTEFSGRRLDRDDSPVMPGSSRTTENEEWAWMVAEDPVFYLSKPVELEDVCG